MKTFELLKFKGGFLTFPPPKMLLIDLVDISQVLEILHALQDCHSTLVKNCKDKDAESEEVSLMQAIRR